MNLPNKLTILRMLLIPVFLLFFLTPSIPGNYFAALVVFAAACITDTLDGQIARKYGLITDFGKLMDPLADKMLVMSAIVCFITVMDVPPVFVIIILAREFLVTSLRLIAAGKGTVIAADKWGKTKTVTQMIWIIYGLTLRCFMDYLARYSTLSEVLRWVFVIGMLASVLTTVLSGWNYMYNNRELFLESK